MGQSHIFFWVVPILYFALAAVFFYVARTHRDSSSASMAARAFTIALIAILIDTQRNWFPSGFFVFAVPLHWLVIHYSLDAFLLRHGERLPRRVWLVFALGLAINLFFAFVVPRVGVRVPNSQGVGAVIIAMGLPMIWRHRRGLFDRAIAWVVAASFGCYLGRLLLYFMWDYGHGYAAHPTWSPYMTLFYFTSGIIALASAMLLLLAITADLIERHHRTATVDALTGLGNRHMLDKLAGAHGDGSGKLGAVMILDLDHFKAINDAHGHAMGDGVLRAAAQTIRNCAGSFGHIVRLGGEEVAVLLRHYHADAAPQLAHVLRQAIALQHVDAPDALPPVTTSIGVALLCAGEGLGDAMRRADMALYAAKNGGRDRVVVASNAMDAASDAAQAPRFAWM
ncbi:MAG: GGDEF domain-containing protein [Sphingomonadaceae bacterium]|nr:GGDEF domain-containing protein [Sphingomonadaceae bacterium]